MIWACLSLILVGAAISTPLTAVLIRLGHRLKTFDSPGVAGQVKAAPRRVPNTGGVAVFLGVAIPLLAALVALNLPGLDRAPSATESGIAGVITRWVPALHEHLPGIRDKTLDAAALVGALLIVHVMGLADDRRPLKAIPKLLVMIGVCSALVGITGSRMLTLLDPYAGGAWLSYAVTVAWIIVVMNAMNFLDNMDGLSAGIGAITAAFFLAAALVGSPPQWFIAACLALLIGSLAGFLLFNAPRPWSGRAATIFMGDGGSLVVGLLLAFLSVRITYAESWPSEAVVGGVAHVAGSFATTWLGVFTPLVVLAIPLYDFTTVVILRLSQGKNPLVGDLQHVSHRLVQRGLTRRGAVYVLWALTAATGCGAISLRSLQDWQAALVVAQTLMILGVLFAYEHASRHTARPLRPGAPGGAATPTADEADSP
ncbi:MAG: undecaprenyl-phosphate alpha-N-acetylglucosaminyl 1-phosphate transferase [Phycisphaerae bacterium]